MVIICGRHGLRPSLLNPHVARWPRVEASALEYVASPAAGLWILGRVDEAVLAVHKEREVFVVPRRRHLGNRHHTDTMTL